mmetsp:Transcript_10158/g.14041  ORF Transcript_10158/g.14041 Transcript_10158/m.14041 type:complete len:127 (-) Transcript_10158:885-1265(-)
MKSEAQGEGVPSTPKSKNTFAYDFFFPPTSASPPRGADVEPAVNEAPTTKSAPKSPGVYYSYFFGDETDGQPVTDSSESAQDTQNATNPSSLLNSDALSRSTSEGFYSFFLGPDESKSSGKAPTTS